MQVVQITEQPECDISFQTFYTIFPRREARKDALKAWGQLSPGDQLRAIVAIASWRRVFLDRGLQFTPLAATWLRGERWEDELPQEHQSNHASHKAVVTDQSQRTGPIPEHVRTLFAKLRKP